MKTPNITRLARLGRVYTNAQANVPVCSGSRAATLFGFQPYTSGCYTNEELWHRNPFLTSRASVVKFFKNQNYFTATDRQIAASMDALIPKPPYAPRRGGGGGGGEAARAASGEQFADLGD